MSGYTPGPWTVRKVEPGWSESCAVTNWIDGPGCVPVADVKVQSASDANTRLIAAAPDLLAALVAMLSIVEGDHCRVSDGAPEDEVYHDVTKARAAIAKAGGA